MKISALIKMLKDFEKKYGSDAQIFVPRSTYQRSRASIKDGIWQPQFGQEIFIHKTNIATNLDSKGPEVEW